MSNEPTLVVLGASGDLAARLLFPALLSLEHRERLEGLRIIGYARQEWTTDQFHENLRAAIDKTGADYDQKYCDRFIDRIEFHGGDLSVKSLRGLKPVLDGPAIFYLALPPGVFADAAETIAKAGLADEANGWRRLVIEKPFGTDLTTALALNEQLHKGWREDQIFRIDHFLGKETVQNLLVFRFANRLIEPVLRGDHVDEIQITVAETLGVENRSRYYDGIGALRDMIQNHLVQMMTFATMEPPALWDAEMIRDHKVEVLKAVRAVDPEADAVRGQYTAGLVDGEARIGYRAEPGVDGDVAHRHVRGVATPPRHMALGGRAGAAALGQAPRGQDPRGRVPVQGAADAPVPAHAARARGAQLARVPHEPQRVHRARRAHEAAWPRARGTGGGAPRRIQRARRPRGLGLRAVAARRVDRRPHAVPSLRRGGVVVANCRPRAQGVGGRSARGLRRRQRRPSGPTPLPRVRPLLAAVEHPRLSAAARLIAAGHAPASVQRASGGGVAATLRKKRAASQIAASAATMPPLRYVPEPW